MARTKGWGARLSWVFGYRRLTLGYEHHPELFCAFPTPNPAARAYAHPVCSTDTTAASTACGSAIAMPPAAAGYVVGLGHTG